MNTKLATRVDFLKFHQRSSILELVMPKDRPMDVYVRKCQMNHSPKQAANEAARDALKQDSAQHRPASPLEQISRELGWNLIESQRGKRL